MFVRYAMTSPRGTSTSWPRLQFRVRRLFATGQSSGGYFSQTLGCQRGHVFRAVAPSSGGWRDFENCMGNPGVWMSHGKTDTGTLADWTVNKSGYSQTVGRHEMFEGKRR